MQINLIDKFNIRKSLRQLQSESVSEFFERCILAQFAITDDDDTFWRDPMFERDVALNFLLGLRPEFHPGHFFIEVQSYTSVLMHLAWQQSVIFFHTWPGTFDIFIKSAWQQSVICFRTLPGTLNNFIKREQ